MELSEEEIRAILAGTEPSTLQSEQVLRDLQRAVASKKAELEALRSKHEQVCTLSEVQPMLCTPNKCICMSTVPF